MSIRTLFVDLGKVLVDFDIKLVCSRFAGITRLPNETIERVLFGELHDQYETGLLTSREFYHRVLLDLGTLVPEDEFWEAFCADLVVREPTLRVINEARGVRLIVASNVDQMRFAYIYETGIFRSFHQFGLSYRLRVKKPKPHFFTKLLELAAAPPHQCLLVDDLPENVEAAARHGIQTVRYTSADALRASLAGYGIIP